MEELQNEDSIEFTKSKKVFSQYYRPNISVTIDFLKTIPGFDIKTEEGLRAALYAIGFRVQDKEGNLEDISVLSNKNVRCLNKPYLVRKTMIFVGHMRKDFKYGAIYNGVEILDVNSYEGTDTEAVTDLPYEVIGEVKANTRKYTKKEDRESVINIDFTADDLSRLDEICGLEV